MSDKPISRVRPQPWASFDDIVIGQTFEGFGRTVTDAEIVMMTAMTTGFHQPLHTNAEWIKANTSFANILLPGPIIVAYAIGLLSATQVYSDITIAFLGLDKVVAKAPVYGGDTITPKATVFSKRVTSNPEKGVVELEIDVIKQDDSVVMTFIYKLMVHTHLLSESK